MSYREFTIKELFWNKEMRGILPQFNSHNKQSQMTDERYIKNKLKRYLADILNGVIENGNIIVNGKKSEVLRAVKYMQPRAQEMFNFFPEIFRYSRIGPTKKIYMPFVSISHIKEVFKKDFYNKSVVIQCVVDSFKYSPKINRLRCLNQTYMYKHMQKAWMERVGYR